MARWCVVLFLLLTTLPVQQSLLVQPPPTRRRSAAAYRQRLRSIIAPKDGDDDGQEHNARTVPTSLYIHIPFCRQRCRYCDFAIVPVGSTFEQRTTMTTTTTPDLEATYLRAVLHELDRTLADHHPPTTPLRTIYFGGGTPSLAQASTILAILDRVRRYCTLAEDVEITIEMDPGTFDASYLRALSSSRMAGSSTSRWRVSLGVQAADDTVLASLGRTHRRVDIDDAVRLLHTSSTIQSVSMDLITGVPGVSLAAWMDCLATAVHTWQPDHLSVYDLQVEPVRMYEWMYV